MLLGALVLGALSCAQGKVDPFDVNSGLTHGEIEDALIKKREAKNSKSDNIKKPALKNITPKISSLVIAPPPPIIGGDKIISLAISDEVDTKDVLIELGRIANIDVDIDSNISGNIIINAKDRPLKEVIDRIASLGKLRYSYKNGVLFFENDAPYVKNYYVDYMVAGKLWGEVESNVKAIMDADEFGARIAQFGMDGMAMGMGMGGMGMGMGGMGMGGMGMAPNMMGVAPMNMQPNMAMQQPNGVIQPNGMQPNMLNGAMPAMGMQPNMMNQFNLNSLTSNKSAGILSVFATKKQHQAVEKYLKDVEKYASAQVLIEAKVVEVTLSKEFAAGIDWSWADSENSIISKGLFGVGDSTTPYITGVFGKNSSINATVKALEQFGSAKAISSPRITTMNNQNATLNFSENLIYFTVATSASTVAGVNNPTTIAAVTATKNEIPIGVQLSITPSINVATNEVTLEVAPTLSVNSGKFAIDPSINPTTGESLGNKIPIVKTRTLKTLAKIQSGNVLVIGGLMSDTTANSDSGIPLLGRIPLLGYLFKNSSKSSQVVETVIFIKVTIVDSAGFSTKEDRELEEKFDVNKRKFF